MKKIIIDLEEFEGKSIRELKLAIFRKLHQIEILHSITRNKMNLNNHGVIRPYNEFLLSSHHNDEIIIKEIHIN